MPVPPTGGGSTKTCGLCGTSQSDAAQSCYRCGGDLSPANAKAGSEKGRTGTSAASREPRARGRRSGGSGGSSGLTGQKLLFAVLAVVLVAAVGVGLMLKFRSGDASADAQVTESGSSSALGGAMDSAKNAAVEANTRLIMTGVESYMAENGRYPDPADVSQGGAVGQVAGQWPMNPFTRTPAKSGSAPGDYTYELVSGGAGFRLVGHGADGPVCTLP